MNRMDLKFLATMIEDNPVMGVSKQKRGTMRGYTYRPYWYVRSKDKTLVDKVLQLIKKEGIVIRLNHHYHALLIANVMREYFPQIAPHLKNKSVRIFAKTMITMLKLLADREGMKYSSHRRDKKIELMYTRIRSLRHEQIKILKTRR